MTKYLKKKKEGSIKIKYHAPIALFLFWGEKPNDDSSSERLIAKELASCLGLFVKSSQRRMHANKQTKKNRMQFKRVITRRD